MIIRRGDIMQARYGENGSVPVLVVSEGVFNQRSGTVIAVTLLKEKPASGFPLSHPLSVKVEGRNVWAKCSQIKTLSTLQLGRPLAHAEKLDIQGVLDGLGEIING